MNPQEQLDETSMAVRMGDYFRRCCEIVEGRQPLQSLAVRKCGDCNLCCHAPAIGPNEIEPHERPWFPVKPAGAPCKHLDQCGKCSIYHKRASICRGYMCLYLTGLVDRSPMDGKICWTLQPDIPLQATFVLGHCQDIDAVLSDPENRKDLAMFLAYRGEPRLSCVVLCSDKHAVRFDMTGKLPDLMGDMDPSDPLHLDVDDSTTRPSQWKR